jgi:hypothetical protein
MDVLRAASLSETELFDSVTTCYTFIPTLPSLTSFARHSVVRIMAGTLNVACDFFLFSPLRETSVQ